MQKSRFSSKTFQRDSLRKLKEKINYFFIIFYSVFAHYVVAAPTNSTNNLNSTSRPFQAVQLELNDKQNLMPTFYRSPINLLNWPFLVKVS